MAKYTKKTKQDVTNRENYRNDTNPSLIVEQWRKAYDYYQDVREDWEEKEAILINRNLDSLTVKTAKSRVFDPRLSTIIFERMMRVMAQMQTGKARAMGKKDKGKGMLMDLTLKNYVEPNANTQWNLLTKFRIENMYSHVYGAMGHFIDYVMRPDGYIGPDIMLIPARYLVPQPGKYTIQDSQYAFVETWCSKKQLKQYAKSGKWQNIDKLLEASAGDKASGKLRDSDSMSYIQLKFGDNSHTESISDFQQIRLVTRYEPDRWVTFAPDFNIIVRDIANPHQNDRIPIVVKQSIPLIDRFHGLGEIERGKTLQYATNSLLNLYLDGVAYSIFPPKLVNMSQVVKSTIRNQPGAEWVVKDINNSIREFPVSPQGINTFQATYPTLIASMMNMAGTTDTTVSSNVDPGLGKTPQALAMLNQRQNARDTFDREMQEEAIQNTYDIFLDLLTKKQEKPIKLTVFDEELQMIQKTNPDVVDLFESEEGGEIIIKPEDIKGTNFKYYIDKGSTYKQDELLQKQEITDHLSLALKLGDPQEIKQTGKVRLGEYVIDIAELFKKSVISGGMNDWDKVVYEEEMQPEPMVDPNMMSEQDPLANTGGMVPPIDELTGGMPQGQPMQQPQQGANFEDPQIQAVFDDIINNR